MKIRTYAKSVGFDVVGNLTYMGKWDLSSRWYMDEGRNRYIVDTVIGIIRIIPHRRLQHQNISVPTEKGRIKDAI